MSTMTQSETENSSDKRQTAQIGLKGLFVAMLVICAYLGGKASSEFRLRNAIRNTEQAARGLELQGKLLYQNPDEWIAMRKSLHVSELLGPKVELEEESSGAVVVTLTGVTDDTMENLAELLRFKGVWPAKVSKVTIQQSYISNDSISYLKDFPNLLVVDLDDKDVTNEALRVLSRVKVNVTIP